MTKLDHDLANIIDNLFDKPMSLEGPTQREQRRAGVLQKVELVKARLKEDGWIEPEGG